VRRLLVTLRLAAVRVGFMIGRLRPVGNDVVLATAHSSTIDGNLRAIRDDLAARGVPGVRTLAQAHTRAFGRQVHAVVASVLAGYRLARARLFIVDDYFFPLYAIRPRRGTTVVQVWHACGALKRFGYSVLDRRFGADEALVNVVPIHSGYDICLVSSTAAVPFYAEAFRAPPEIFVSELGIPRTDVLADPERRTTAAAAVRSRHALPPGRRVILYAPTFRGDRIGDARAGVQLDLAEMARILGEDHLVLLRLHPFVRDRFVIAPQLRTFVVDASDDRDVNELMAASDVLVTDYSSAVFEFALLRRPIVLHAPDVDEYEQERGLYLDYRSAMPGPVFQATEPLAAWLRAGDFDLERVDRFARTWFDVADGNATRRFSERIVLPTLAGADVRPAQLRARSSRATSSAPGSEAN
jgi:CDP-ribitol ribitolphosphotransferase